MSAFQCSKTEPCYLFLIYFPLNFSATTRETFERLGQCVLFSTLIGHRPNYLIFDLALYYGAER